MTFATDGKTVTVKGTGRLKGSNQSALFPLSVLFPKQTQILTAVVLQEATRKERRMRNENNKEQRGYIPHRIRVG